jgi:hypothetical protein
VVNRDFARLSIYFLDGALAVFHIGLRHLVADVHLAVHISRVPAGDFRFIALDVETACSDAASICQIGLACVQPDKGSQTFSMFVSPATLIDLFDLPEFFIRQNGGELQGLVEGRGARS